MIKHFAIVMSVVALSMSSAFADEKQSTVVNQALQQAAEDQTIFAEFLLGAESVHEMSAQRALLVRIDEWLASNFELPRAAEYPKVECADASKLVALRYNGLAVASSDVAGSIPRAALEQATVAVYVDVESAFDFTQPDSTPGFGVLPPELITPPSPVQLGGPRADDDNSPKSRESAAERSLLAAEMPEIVQEFLFGATDIDEIVAKQSLLDEITKWLAVNFELPVVYDRPQLEHATPEKLAALRYGRLNAATNQAIPAASAQSTTVAIYIDGEQTIYLPQGWTGRTPAELSVLVHEMVHHLQNLGGLKHDCPRAREKLAYAAQERWLKRFGRDLEGEFEINPFTVLVNSTCVY